MLDRPSPKECQLISQLASGYRSSELIERVIGGCGVGHGMPTGFHESAAQGKQDYMATNPVVSSAQLVVHENVLGALREKHKASIREGRRLYEAGSREPLTWVRHGKVGGLHR